MRLVWKILKIRTRQNFLPHGSDKRICWKTTITSKTKQIRQMNFSFRELSDTANAWKDIANDGNLISVYKLKSKVCPLECPRGFQVNDRSLSHIGHANLLCVVLFWSFEMFTGSVIDICFSKKESLLAVTHFKIKWKVLFLKIVYVRLSLLIYDIELWKGGIFLTVSVSP